MTDRKETHNNTAEVKAFLEWFFKSIIYFINCFNIFNVVPCMYTNST
jgi:hypothetical protein